MRIIKDVQSCYISCAYNRTPHCCDWGNNGIICYGACNAVAVYDPKYCYGGGQVLYTLNGHKARVNCVKWVHGKDILTETQFVSGSNDCTAIIWTNNLGTYELSHVLKGHECSVTVTDGIYLSEKHLVVATASVDSTIRVWEQTDGKDIVCKGVVTLQSSGLCLSVSLTSLSASEFLLACGTDDCKIQLFTEKNEQVVKLLNLSGHEDWVRALDFTTCDNGDILLASGSQDATVRLWRFHPPDNSESNKFSLQEQLIQVGQTKLAVRHDALLAGHDGWIYGVHWHPPVVTETGTCIQPERLLSASMDKTVIVWSPEKESGVWLEDARLGEIGGNTLGFYGGRFGPQGMSILACSYHGGFYMWHRFKDGWKPGVTVGGHFDAANDVAWEPKDGRYIVSVSSDQTTRLHAPWVQPNTKQKSWHEIARPQVHGYDLVCLAMLPDYHFASGADEKIVRVFSAPENFLSNFDRLCLDGSNQQLEKSFLPCGATVPNLGLSNKAVYWNEVEITKEKKSGSKGQDDDEMYFTPQVLNEPPTEDILLQNTLWPEVKKLYGHGYEIYSLATSPDGKLLASACKATVQKHASIMLWNTKSWQRVGVLMSHQLTVTQLSFSPNNQYLLSVSRDRRWSLFEKQPEGSEELYRLYGVINHPVHARIIWCCAWTHNSMFFATGSREGKVVIWGKYMGDDFSPIYQQLVKREQQKEAESVTSLAFAPVLFNDNNEYLLAVGTESGMIRLYAWQPDTDSSRDWLQCYQLDNHYGHHLAVKRLAFRPVLGKAGDVRYAAESDTDSVLQLASAGLDHTIKVHNIYLNYL